ncbi:phage protein [Cohnella kolymensis]|uniref:Phage protein n=1 Tax=Cohnella kolymensis TaxID=1590652 RepID=A0ABR5A4B6_9BACL|nr:DUF1071 domain-containing protein [Cohnella kolymensis]KIL35841.1 phage protein [Cohnella kolymensis]
MSDNYFSKLAAIDVGEHIEKKGKFSYLSWPYAVKTLRETDPTATWEVVRHEGMPYLKTECGYFVEVAVTCQGVTLSQIHPVLDNNNRPITQPNAFQINTSIQRGLVKSIALHGLGLYIYAGEDLPESAEEPKEAQKEEVKQEAQKPSAALAKVVGEIKTAWLTKGYKLNAIDAQCQKLYECKFADLNMEKAIKFLDLCKQMPRKEQSA